MWTFAETQQQMAMVSELLVQYASATQIAKALRDAFGVGAKRSATLIKRTQEQWEQQSEPERKHARERAVRSVRRALAQVEGRMAGTRDPVSGAVTPPSNADWLQLGRLRRDYYEQLMNLEGTRARLEMDVNVTAEVAPALVATIATLDEARTTRWLEWALRLEQLEQERTVTMLPEGTEP